MSFRVASSLFVSSLFCAALGGCWVWRMFAEPQSADGAAHLVIVRGADSVHADGWARASDFAGTDRGPALTLHLPLPTLTQAILPLGDSIVRPAQLDIYIPHRPANGRFEVAPSRAGSVRVILWSLGGGPRWEARSGIVTIRDVRPDAPTRLRAELYLVLVSEAGDTIRVSGAVSTRDRKRAAAA